MFTQCVQLYPVHGRNYSILVRRQLVAQLFQRSNESCAHSFLNELPGDSQLFQQVVVLVVV